MTAHAATAHAVMWPPPRPARAGRGGHGRHRARPGRVERAIGHVLTAATFAGLLLLALLDADAVMPR